MTRLILAAGVAALAIAAPASAGPGGGHGGGGGHGNGGGHGGGGAPAVNGGGGGSHGGGGGHGNGGGHGGGAPAFMGGGGGGHGGGRPQAMFMGGGGGGHGHGGGRQMMVQSGGHGHGGGHAAPRMQQAQRQQGHGNGHQQARNIQRQQAHGHAQQQARNVQRQQGHGHAQQQARNVERQQMRGFERQQAHGNAMRQAQQQAFAGQSMDIGKHGKGQKFAGQAFTQQDAQIARQQQQAFRQQLEDSRFAALNYGTPQQLLAPTVVQQFVGVPVSAVPEFASLSRLPASWQYLYPATPNYYYQWGDGYVYQVDRGTNLIDALIPLLAGGYYPGQYLPANYMSSYVPAYYGLNSFYPDSPYSCNRYYNGVIYQVDCASGYVENVVPVYAAGYGVGQYLPGAYNYYNVPMQYRSMYYDTPDYGYWYSPGAIYQYDRGTSVITSVAALMSPGFTIGQPLPAGYGVYNVPYDYRATYYDTPDAWYRYNNGYIYQVDPVTQLVTAIVASLLT